MAYVDIDLIADHNYREKNRREIGMCLSTVFLNSTDQKKQIIMKDVARIEAADKGFWMINLFGEKIFVEGTVQAIDLVDGHFVMLEHKD